MIFPPAPPHQAAGRAASFPSLRAVSLLRFSLLRRKGSVSKNRVCLSTAEKKLSTIPRQKQAKWTKFSVLSRISLFHRQENLRKGLTTDWKSVKIHIDHIRVIWRIRIILSAGAGRVRREERRPRLLSSKQQCKKGEPKAVHRGFLSRFRFGLRSVRRKGGGLRSVRVPDLKKGAEGFRIVPRRESRGAVRGRFCDFREILSHFTAKRLTTLILHDRICSEVSYRKGMTSVSKNI